MAIFETVESIKVQAARISAENKKSWKKQLQQVVEAVLANDLTDLSARERSFKLYSLSRTIEGVKLNEDPKSNTHAVLDRLQRALVTASDKARGKWLGVGANRSDFDRRLETLGVVDVLVARFEPLFERVAQPEAPKGPRARPGNRPAAEA